METIRFAAFNRLCVDISYVKENGEHNRYRVEPYSLYRTQEDNIILRAVKVGTGEPRSFRIDRIQSVKATNTSFVPRFEIEMFEHSASLGKMPTPRSTYSPSLNPFPARSRQRSTAHTGPSYIYKCTTCQKLFRHSSMNAQLQAHKDKHGMPCYGRTGHFIETKY